MLTAELRTHRKTQTAERLASPPLRAVGTAFIGLSGAVEALRGISANRRGVELVGGSRKRLNPFFPCRQRRFHSSCCVMGQRGRQIVQPSIGIRESITTRCGQWSHSCDLIPGHQVCGQNLTPNLVGVVAQAIEGGLSARGSVGPPVAEAKTYPPLGPCSHISRALTTRTHRPLCPCARDFKKLCEVAKIPPRRLHDLRHSAATMMLDNDLDLKTVGQLLGGSDVCLPTPPCCLGLVAQKCWQNGSIHHWVLGSRRREGFELLEQALRQTSAADNPSLGTKALVSATSVANTLDAEASVHYAKAGGELAAQVGDEATAAPRRPGEWAGWSVRPC